MFRTAGVTLLSVLTIGMVAVVLEGWRLQRNVSAQLETLTATQQALLAQQRPPRVEGRCYLGDPSKPARDVEVQVFRFSDVPAGLDLERWTTGFVARRLRTDEQGRFESGILQSGEYCLLAPVLRLDGSASADELLFGRLQSRPLSLFPGVAETSVDLNLGATGRIRLAASGIPATVRIGEKAVPIMVGLHAYTAEEMQRLRIPSWEMPVAPSDEPPQGGWPLPLPLPPSWAGLRLTSGRA